MTLVIPKDPQMLALQIDHLWNGDPCPDERVWAGIQLRCTNKGLHLRVEAPVLHDQRVPAETAIGTRVEGLWNFDVVELFLVGPGHQYTEIELGAGGHFLILGFDRIRHRSREFETFFPTLFHQKTQEKTWVSELVLPFDVLPENVRALNAFVFAAGQYLALSPLPGEKPDFHQPDYYPAAMIQ